MVYDVCIIGAGITGCSIAYELSKYNLSTIVLEKENDVAMKTTKANSGIIHAGYDPMPNTLMAELNVLGNKLVEEAHEKLNFHLKPIGSLVIGSTQKEHETIDELYDRGLKNKVPELKIIKGKDEIHKLEPNLNENIDYALYAPSAKVVSPWELAIALANTAKINGAEFIFNCEIKKIVKTIGYFEIKVNKPMTIKSKIVINCAGCHADEIYKLALNGKKADDEFTISPVIGEYYLLDKDEGTRVSHTIFQTPTDKGKGVLVSPTVHGNLIVGPDANSNLTDKNYVGNTSEGLNYVKTQSKLSVSSINFGSNIRNFAGVRATIKGKDDFLIAESSLLKGFINFAGIKSPGLSCSLAFGKKAVQILQSKNITLTEKEDFKYYRLPDYFSEISNDEKIKLIEKDKRFGQVICRCETVTEGEIIEALHMPIPATTIDGVKRRTNAGMGRCQGGFCGPKIFDIIKKELNIDGLDVYQDTQGSKVCLSKTKGEK